MKIAVTYDNGKVWQHFGKTESFKLYEAEDGRIVSSEVVSTGGAAHGALADFLAGKGVEAVICGGVGAPMVDRLAAFGIKTYPGVSGDADEAAAALAAGTLSVNADAVHEGCRHGH